MSKEIDKHLHDIVYVIAIVVAIALPGSLLMSYLIEFELNQPLEFPIIQQGEIDEMTAHFTLYNNVRAKGVAQGDELVFFSKYIRDPEKFSPRPIIYLEVGGQKIFEETLKPDEPRSSLDPEAVHFYKKIMINQTGSTVFGIDTEYFKITGGEYNKKVKQFHSRYPFLVKSLSEIEQRESLRIVWIGLISSSIIGGTTVIAITINSKISRSQSRTLEEQKNVMRDNAKKQNAILKEQNKISKKHIEYLAMLEIMKIFNDPRIADERNQIYFANRNNILYDKDGQIQGSDFPSYVASVRGTFDQMGKLVLDEYVPKDQFLEMYCGSVIKMYKVLRRHIEYERKRRNTKHFSEYFETIFNESIAYWKNKFPGEPEPEPF